MLVLAKAALIAIDLECILLPRTLAPIHIRVSPLSTPLKRMNIFLLLMARELTVLATVIGDPVTTYIL